MISTGKDFIFYNCCCPTIPHEGKRAYTPIRMATDRSDKMVCGPANQTYRTLYNVGTSPVRSVDTGNLFHSLRSFSQLEGSLTESCPAAPQWCNVI